jgi:hypothetical protein
MVISEGLQGGLEFLLAALSEWTLWEGLTGKRRLLLGRWL